MRWSDGSYLEDQDHWWLSGISRDVTLLTKPTTHISNFAVTTPLKFGGDGALQAARHAMPTAARTSCCLARSVLRTVATLSTHVALPLHWPDLLENTHKTPGMGASMTSECNC